VRIWNFAFSAFLFCSNWNYSFNCIFNYPNSACYLPPGYTPEIENFLWWNYQWPLPGMSLLSSLLPPLPLTARAHTHTWIDKISELLESWWWKNPARKFLQNLDGNRHIVWHHVNNELEFAKYHTRWRVSDGSKIQWGNFLKNLGGSGCIVWQLVNNEARIKLYQTFRTDVGVAAAACNRCCAIRYIMW
jgi:hypothetical protein